jgi:hypothetical protein
MLTLGFLLTLATVPAGAATIFYDNFDGLGSANLNGTMPDITTGGVAWVASSHFKADGYAQAIKEGSSATLAFAPVSGRIYTLDCSLSGVSGDTDWFALGFASGQSTEISTGTRFVEKNVIGKVWMFVRGNDSSEQNMTWLGNATSGTSSSAAWSTYANNSGGNVLMRIILDTTGGAGNWTATWYAKKPSDTAFFEVQPETKLLNESINSVGLAISRPTVQGTIESFMLSEGIPVVWVAESTSAITTNSAIASATVSTNVTDAVLVWDTADQGIGSAKKLGLGVAVGLLVQLLHRRHFPARLRHLDPVRQQDGEPPGLENVRAHQAHDRPRPQGCELLKIDTRAVEHVQQTSVAGGAQSQCADEARDTRQIGAGARRRETGCEPEKRPAPRKRRSQTVHQTPPYHPDAHDGLLFSVFLFFRLTE